MWCREEVYVISGAIVGYSWLCPGCSFLVILSWSDNVKDPSATYLLVLHMISPALYILTLLCFSLTRYLFCHVLYILSQLWQYLFSKYFDGNSANLQQMQHRISCFKHCYPTCYYWFFSLLETDSTNNSSEHFFLNVIFFLNSPSLSFYICKMENRLSHMVDVTKLSY